LFVTISLILLFFLFNIPATSEFYPLSLHDALPIFMSVNQLVRNTLLSLGVPVQKLVYTGTATTYITYFFYNEMEALKADDDEQIARYSVQVDVWGKGDIEALAE